MSVFSPTSYGGQPDRKKALLDQLMQQYHDAASRAAGLEQAQGGLAGAVGATPFRAAHQFGGTGLYTAIAHALPPGLAALLGPGAIGVPNPGNTSGAPGGSTIGHPGPPGGHPGIQAGGLSNPIAAQAAVMSPAATAPVSTTQMANTNTIQAATAPNAIDPASAEANAGRLAQLHPEIVQRIARQRAGLYASPFHSGIGII